MGAHGARRGGEAGAERRCRRRGVRQRERRRAGVACAGKIRRWGARDGRRRAAAGLQASLALPWGPWSPASHGARFSLSCFQRRENTREAKKTFKNPNLFLKMARRSESKSTQRLSASEGGGFVGGQGCLARRAERRTRLRVPGAGGLSLPVAEKPRSPCRHPSLRLAWCWAARSHGASSGGL